MLEIPRSLVRVCVCVCVCVCGNQNISSVSETMNVTRQILLRTIDPIPEDVRSGNTFTTSNLIGVERVAMLNTSNNLYKRRHGWKHNECDETLL